MNVSHVAPSASTPSPRRSTGDRARPAAVLLACAIAVSGTGAAAERGQSVYIREDAPVEAFVDALEASVTSGPTTIILAAGTVIDASNLEGLELGAGSKLHGERGGVRPVIASDDLDTLPALAVVGAGASIDNVEFRGPDTERRTEQMKSLREEGKYYSLPNSRGVQISADDVTVSDSEFSGWSHAGVMVDGGADGVVVRDSDFHHNQREGLGYGIVVDGASVRIEHNRFDFNRHAIASSGHPESAYVAIGNTVGPNANSHAFDVHGKRSETTGEKLAGRSFEFRENVFLLNDYPAILVRGAPAEPSIVSGNTFCHDDAAAAFRVLGDSVEPDAPNRFGSCDR